MPIISLCVNDPDNGSCTNKLYAIEFSDVLKLESSFWPDPGVIYRVVDSTHVKIGRRTFSVAGIITWYGNWCWDGIKVDPKTFVEIFNYVQSLRLHGQQKFTPDSGITRLWDIYKSGRPLKIYAGGEEVKR